jgi:hypothetical protein
MEIECQGARTKIKKKSKEFIREDEMEPNNKDKEERINEVSILR